MHGSTESSRSPDANVTSQSDFCTCSKELRLLLNRKYSNFKFKRFSSWIRNRRFNHKRQIFSLNAWLLNISRHRRRVVKGKKNWRRTKVQCIHYLIAQIPSLHHVYACITYQLNGLHVFVYFKSESLHLNSRFIW